MRIAIEVRISRDYEFRQVHLQTTNIFLLFEFAAASVVKMLCVPHLNHRTCHNVSDNRLDFDDLVDTPLP